MAKKYGISFCQEGLRRLEEKENQLFAKTGFGFDRFSEDYLQLLRYKSLLKQFKVEYELGMEPSYDPVKHGSL